MTRPTWTLLLAMLGTLGCTNKVEDSGDDGNGDGGSEDGGGTAACDDGDCAYDEFCYQDACTPIDGRTFEISFPYGVESDAEDGSYAYYVWVSSNGDNCTTERQVTPVEEFPETCELLVLLDQPNLEVELKERYLTDSWHTALSVEYLGVDDLVALARDGGDTLSGSTEYFGHQAELRFDFTPTF